MSPIEAFAIGFAAGVVASVVVAVVWVWKNLVPDNMG